MSTHLGTDASRSTIRVATYNLRDFLDDPVAAARVIRAIDPDVLCLQEVPRRLLGTWRVANFAQTCRMYWPGHHQGSGGTTIFTSLRVQTPQSTHRRLAVRFLVRRRGYAVTSVVLPDHHPITVASVHLSLAADERERHAARILDALAGSGDVVVAGDLNEGEEGRAHRSIAGRYRVVSPGAATFPTSRPERVIDIVFASPDLVVRPGGPVDLDEADLRAASDHRPVWVEVVARPLES